MTPIVDNLFTPPERHPPYGPTSDALTSRHAKLVMVLEVRMATVMFTVLILPPYPI